MMKKLRGRNLAHPGCLVGVTAGMTLGIVLAAILASVFAIALNTVLLVWLGLTLGLGVAGWIIGDRLSSRFPALEEDQPQENGGINLVMSPPDSLPTRGYLPPRQGSTTMDDGTIPP